MCTSESVHVTVLTADKRSRWVWWNLHKSQPPDRNQQIRQPASEWVCVLLLLSRQHLPPSSRRDQTGHTLPDWAPHPQTNGSTESHSSAPRGGEETNEWKGGGEVWAPGSRQFVNERELQTPSSPICHSKAPHFTADQTQCRLHCCYSIPPPRRLLDSDWGVWKELDSSLLRVFPQSVLLFLDNTLSVQVQTAKHTLQSSSGKNQLTDWLSTEFVVTFQWASTCFKCDSSSRATVPNQSDSYRYRF